MFQLLLFTGSIIAFIIGGLAVLIGIGVITGCAGFISSSFSAKYSCRQTDHQPD